MRKIYFCLCLVVLLGVNAFCGQLQIADLVDIDCIAQKLGDGWKSDRAMVLEGEDNLSKMSEEQKRFAKRILDNLKSKGITGFGDYSFTRTEAPINNVILLVQKFSSADKAAAHGEKKYEGQKQKSRYKKTVTKNQTTYDNLLWNRRVVVYGRFIVTAEHAQQGDLHEEIIKNCIKFGGKEKKDAVKSSGPSPSKKNKIHEFKEYGFSIKGSDKLITLDTKKMKYLSDQVNRGVVMHAKAKGVNAEKVKSEILFYQSLHKIDAGKDNPNIIVSVENNWQGTEDPSGKDFLVLLNERFKKFKSPNAFKGKPGEKKINGRLFYVHDAVNTYIKGARTRQKYYVTYHEGNFIFFVVSYNNEKSETFKLFESVIQSFSTLGDREKKKNPAS